MAFGSDEGNKLSVLDGDDGPQRNGKNGLTVQLEYLDRSLLESIELLTILYYFQ